MSCCHAHLGLAAHGELWGAACKITCHSSWVTQPYALRTIPGVSASQVFFFFMREWKLSVEEKGEFLEAVEWNWNVHLPNAAHGILIPSHSAVLPICLQCSTQVPCSFAASFASVSLSICSYFSPFLLLFRVSFLFPFSFPALILEWNKREICYHWKWTLRGYKIGNGKENGESKKTFG